jgi:hypothetical protein
MIDVCYYAVAPEWHFTQKRERNKLKHFLFILPYAAATDFAVAIALCAHNHNREMK